MHGMQFSWDSWFSIGVHSAHERLESKVRLSKPISDSGKWEIRGAYHKGRVIVTTKWGISFRDVYSIISRTKAVDGTHP